MRQPTVGVCLVAARPAEGRQSWPVVAAQRQEGTEVETVVLAKGLVLVMSRSLDLRVGSMGIVAAARRVVMG